MHSEITNSGITSPTGSIASQAVRAHRQPGPPPILYGLPCTNCRLYYAAELAVCPNLQLRGSYFTLTGLVPSHVDAIEVRPPEVRIAGPTWLRQRGTAIR